MGWVYITVRANTYIRMGEVALAFEIRAKDLPQGKFPNSTFEGLLGPAREDPAETNDQITDKSSGGRASPRLPVENITLQESQMDRPVKEKKNKKTSLLPCPRLRRDLPQPQHRPDQAAVPDEPGRDSS